MRPLNSTTGNSQDYRGLLVAKVTAAHEPGGGPLAGRKVYEWVEQVMSATGGEETPAQPRAGVYSSPTNFDNVLLDANDADLTIGSYVWARMKGNVGGATVYETVVAVSAAAAGDCRKALAGLLDTDCVTFRVLAGSGTCSGVGAKTLRGYRSVPAEEKWYSAGTFTTALGPTSLRLEFAEDDGDPVVFAVYETADGSTPPAEAALTYVGCAADGSAEYVGRPTPWCDGEPAGGCADNTFRVRVACAGCTGTDYCAPVASITGCFDVSQEWLEGFGFTGCTDGVRVQATLGRVGVVAGEEGGAIVYEYQCQLHGPAVYLGFNSNPAVYNTEAPCSGVGTGTYAEFVGGDGFFKIGFDPDAFGGLGGWGLAIYPWFGHTGGFIGASIPSPEPDADPWVLDFGGVVFTRDATCPAPISDPPDPVTYDCVAGVCTETPGGPYENDPTCGGDCDPDPGEYDCDETGACVPTPGGAYPGDPTCAGACAPTGACCTDAGEVFESGVVPISGPAGVTWRNLGGMVWEGTEAGQPNTYWYFFCEGDAWKINRFVAGAQTGPVTATAADCAAGTWDFPGESFGIADFQVTA